jgi:hypothetical protein
VNFEFERHYPSGEEVREGDNVECVLGKHAGQQGKVLDPDSLGGPMIRFRTDKGLVYSYCLPEGLKLISRTQAGRRK